MKNKCGNYELKIKGVLHEFEYEWNDGGLLNYYTSDINGVSYILQLCTDKNGSLYNLCLGEYVYNNNTGFWDANWNTVEYFCSYDEALAINKAVKEMYVDCINNNIIKIKE